MNFPELPILGDFVDWYSKTPHVSAIESGVIIKCDPDAALVIILSGSGYKFEWVRWEKFIVNVIEDEVQHCIALTKRRNAFDTPKETQINKIPSGDWCNPQGMYADKNTMCPCLNTSNVAYCQAFREGLNFDKGHVHCIRLLRCLATYPKGGHIVPVTQKEE